MFSSIPSTRCICCSHFLGAAWFCLLCPSVAVAAVMPEPGPVVTPADVIAKPPVLTPPITVEAAAKSDPNPPGQLGLTVGLPFFDESVTYPDLTVDLRYGHRFWWLVPSLGGGFRQLRLNPRLVPEIAEKKKILAWHVSLGLRVEFPATRRLFPFVGLSTELAYWASTADTTDYCRESYYPNSWRCYEAMLYRPGAAIKPILGIVFKAEPSLALEAWVERITALSDGMFTRTVTLYHPAVGVAWHH